MTTHRRLFRLAPLLLAGALTANACLESEPTALRYENPTAGRRVLFIGNSLTYMNDLPVMVQGIADAAQGDSLIVEMIAGPDMALIDHWEKGGALAVIQGLPWDFVVLQQGPSSQPLNRDTLRLAVKYFAPSIAAAGAKPVLFSAWPTIDRGEDFPRAAESYRLAAEDVGGLYAPVANAWVEAWKRDPDLQLYSDGLHASVPGSYLAALVIYSRIMGKSPIGLPSTIKLRNGGTLSFPTAMNALLQEAAWAAVSPTLQP